MARIELGADKHGVPQWADIVDVEEMTGRQRREIRDGFPVEMGADGTPTMRLTGGIMDLMRDRLVAMVIEEWSFPDAPTLDSVEALPARMLDKLIEATEPHWELANFSRPGTPGENSSDSKTSFEDRSLPPATTPLPAL